MTRCLSRASDNSERWIHNAVAFIEPTRKYIQGYKGVSLSRGLLGAVLLGGTVCEGQHKEEESKSEGLETGLSFITLQS